MTRYALMFCALALAATLSGVPGTGAAGGANAHAGELHHAADQG